MRKDRKWFGEKFGVIWRAGKMTGRSQVTGESENGITFGMLQTIFIFHARQGIISFSPNHVFHFLINQRKRYEAIFNFEFQTLLTHYITTADKVWTHRHDNMQV